MIDNLNNVFWILRSQLFWLPLLILSCESPQKSDPDNNSQAEKLSISQKNTFLNYSKNSILIVFKQIDNRAIVYLDDEQVYDSETIDGNPTIDVVVELKDDQLVGKEKLRIDGYNGFEPYTQVDSNWEIVFDIYRNGEVIDFWTGSGSDGSVGKVFSETFFLNDF